jgi:hypothetical protein
MKVFISWSGERSGAVAEELDVWIQCVIQAVDPWMSSKDIDRGSLWFSEINDQLKDTQIGIVCLTHENKNKPWILFESGALAKGLSSNRVCTFLIDLKPEDVDNPLAQFNHTLPNKESVWHLMRTINSTLGDQGLKESILDEAFNTYWPRLSDRLDQILAETPQSDEIQPRTDQSIMHEVLNTIRSLDKRVRHMESTDILDSNVRKGGLLSQAADLGLLSDNDYSSSSVEEILNDARKKKRLVDILFKDVPSDFDNITASDKSQSKIAAMIRASGKPASK